MELRKIFFGSSKETFEISIALGCFQRFFEIFAALREGPRLLSKIFKNFGSPSGKRLLFIVPL
jgi:hypothetical protein